MTQLCEITQIGRVGKIKHVGSNLAISIASDASYKKDGEWQDKSNWIEHTIFARQGGVMKWTSDTLKPGDLVMVRSTPSQTKWEVAGETRYGYTFAVNTLQLLTAKEDKPAEQPTAGSAKATPKSRR
jgi:single-strand DNA-binding protein